MTKKEFHRRIKQQQFDGTEKGEWWHPDNGDIYCEIGDRLVAKGIDRTEVLQILRECHQATADEYGS